MWEYSRTLGKSEAKDRYWHIQKADRSFFPESDVAFKLKFDGKEFELKVNHKDDIMTGKIYERYRFLEGDRIIVTKKKENIYSLKAPDTQLYPGVK